MSCLHNEMILESLFEKYLEEGHSEEVAEEKAMEEFENMGGPYGQRYKNYWKFWCNALTLVW